MSVKERGAAAWILVAVVCALALAAALLLFGTDWTARGVETKSPTLEAAHEPDRPSELEAPRSTPISPRDAEPVAEPSIVPTEPVVPPKPEDVWKARYAGATRDDLSKRISELKSELGAGIQAAGDERLASGLFEVRPMSDVVDPPQSVGFLGSSRQIVEGGPEPMVHYVAVMAADYPHLGEMKSEMEWLRGEMESR